ncbi:MAG: DUF3422 domain-containing protein [Roseivivax sp.]|nr:DUF3422 domain-containing protein [Roseivivax sp.]
MPSFEDHPLRYALSNELHARPFPSLQTPCRAVFLAIKQPQDAAARDRDADRAHLIELLDRHGTAHPQPGATHYSGRIGQNELRWEQHTEFVTYTAILPGLGARPFDPADFGVFPEDWLARIPGTRISSAMIRIVPRHDKSQIVQSLNDWFVLESLAASSVLDDAMTVAADFHIDPAGHTRFAIFVAEDTGARRIGRIMQRLCEIEAYKTLSMLGFSKMREVSPRMGEIDGDLTRLMDEMARQDEPDERTLAKLLKVSAELEHLSAQTAFRRGATAAYEALVIERIRVMREARFDGRQTFVEFMMRRYDPAMRTVKSAEKRLEAMSARAMRASDLLRTRVEVQRSAQNQQLLESMDRRADLQLQLQKTVEGLSVVAISYYAVSLVSYLLYPVTDWTGLSKGWVMALVTVPVVALVWLMIRRIHHKVDRSRH